VFGNATYEPSPCDHAVAPSINAHRHQQALDDVPADFGNADNADVRSRNQPRSDCVSEIVCSTAYRLLA